MLGFRKLLEIDAIAQNIEYMRRYLGEPVLDLSHLTDSQIHEKFLDEVAGYWGAYDLAAKYTIDTPGQKSHMKLLNRLLKAKRMKETE